MNTKMNQTAQPENSGVSKLRIYHRKKKGRNSPRYLIKCGCCDEKVEIYYDYDEEPKYQTLEINGVIGSLKDWEDILLPLLNIHDAEKEW